MKITMRITNNAFLVALLCVTLAVSGCRKAVDQLPPATQTGTNTFGCLINGKAWIPTGGGAFSGINPTSGGFFGEPNGSVSIYIKAYGEDDDVAIYLKNITAEGRYDLNKNTSIMPAAVLPEASYGMYDIMYDPEFVTDSLHTGAVTITHADRNTGIVSGTFEMTLSQKNTGHVLRITNGRFDYKTH